MATTTAGASTEAESSAEGNMKETPWIDAWIRWERDSKDIVDDEELEEDNDEPAIPTETYSFRYTLPKSEKDPKSDNDVQKAINIELRGFPSESEQIWNSTGLTLWRSSHFLCEYLVQHAADMLRGKKIVELGAGLGRCGILAHCLGAKRVFSTDGDTDTLVQLRSNVSHNLPEINNNNVGTNQITCHQLLWSQETTTSFMDAHQIHGENSVDLVIGSDLVYVPQVIQPLFETVQTLLSKNPNGKFLMAHCSRRVGNSVTIDMVLTAAEESGFQHELLEEEEDISVFLFQWK